jgi:hypothetical protein
MRVLYAGKNRRRDQIFPLQRLARFNTPAADHQATTYVKFRPEKLSKLPKFGSS